MVDNGLGACVSKQSLSTFCSWRDLAMKKFKKILANFKCHVKGHSDYKVSYVPYNIKKVHMFADRWLADMGDLNALAVSDEALGVLCYGAYREAIDEMVKHGDYHAARLVVLRGFPVLKRFCSNSLNDEIENIDSAAIAQGKDPYNHLYINMFELLEAVSRFVEVRAKIIASDIGISDFGKFQGNGLLKMLEDVEADLEFIKELPTFAAGIQFNSFNQPYFFSGCLRSSYCDNVSKALMKTAHAFCIAKDLEKEITMLEALAERYRLVIEEMQNAQSILETYWNIEENSADNNIKILKPNWAAFRAIIELNEKTIKERRVLQVVEDFISKKKCCLKKKVVHVDKAG